MADTQVTVSIENLATTNGTRLTPLWVGFHNGQFDTYNRGEAVTPGLERLAEDGDAAVLGQEFTSNGNGQAEGLVGGAPIAPGATVTNTFTVDPLANNADYFSYASMILPSNDFFVANGNPTAHRIFDDLGNFIGSDFFILGSEVLDAGTEVNDELESSTAFFGQSAPNTGETEGVVRSATGFIPVAQGGQILADPNFANADFTADNYNVAQVEVTSNAADEVTVTFTNLAPSNGTTLTPLWVGFHNGLFDTYNRGEAVTPGLEDLAEDGDAVLLGVEFVNDGNGIDEGPVGTAPIAPGASVTRTFTNIDFSDPESAYFSYASMILPSNDFFVSNGNPLAHRIIDEAGNFIGANFTIAGSEVLDAGTEVSDEIPANTAFFGQAAPNTGVTEGVVNSATGFIPNGRILSAEQFAAADFTADGYQVARVRVSSGQAQSTFTTDFTDLANAASSSDFTAGDFQFGQARFTGGDSFFEGVGALYSSGGRAWVADAGNTLRIDFDAPVSSAAFNAIGLDGATVEAFGEVDQASTVDVGSGTIRDNRVEFTGNITAIELRNTSTQTGTTAAVSAAALDDLTYTVASTAPVRPDLSGDGSPDILWRNSNNGVNALWTINEFELTNSAFHSTIEDTNWVIATYDDFDGDGNADLLLRNQAVGINLIRRLDADGVTILGDTQLPDIPDLNWEFIDTADFNQDGNADILLRHRAAGVNLVWNLDSAGALESTTALDPIEDPNWTIAASVDFNGDGNADLLLRNQATGINLIRQLDGVEILGDIQLPDVVDSNLHIEGARDFNGDGNADIVWRNRSTGANSFWELNGTQFVREVALASVDSSWQLVV